MEMKCKALKFIDEMKEEIFTYVESVEKYSDRAKQVMLCEMMRYIDFVYEKETITQNNTSRKTVNLIEYGVPLLIKHLALKNKNIEGAMLLPSNKQRQETIKQLLDVLEILGVLNICQKYIEADMLTPVYLEKNILELKFTNKYSDLERIDRISTVAYSNDSMYSLMPLNILLAKKAVDNQMLAKMERLVYQWNEYFIAYGADEQIDDYFEKSAAIDLVQDAEWNCFEQTDKFDNIEYEVFVGAVLMVESFAIKHLQFVYIALEKYPAIDKYNNLYIYYERKTILECLKIALNIDEITASKVFEVLSLKQEEISQISNENLPLPPYIEIAKDYFIRSFAGCLFEPINYMLYKLNRKYPKDWNKNIQKREARFRDEFYDLFPDRYFLKLRRNIVLKSNGQTITDIDACLYEKEEGNIIFVQLKWQDTIYDSFKSMMSKRRNYTNKVKQWIKTMKDWIDYTNENTIANHLQIKAHQVNKNKIYLLVIGRYNASYSYSENSFNGAEYCQWFELQRLLKANKEKMYSGKFGYKDIKDEINSFQSKKEQQRKIKSGIEYNGKKIIYDGLFYNEA